MFELKRLSDEAIPAALEKALRYRLLDEPAEAESICHDVLEIDPKNQQALVVLLLALTDLTVYVTCLSKQEPNIPTFTMPKWTANLQLKWSRMNRGSRRPLSESCNSVAQRSLRRGAPLRQPRGERRNRHGLAAGPSDSCQLIGTASPSVRMGATESKNVRSVHSPFALWVMRGRLFQTCR